MSTIAVNAITDANGGNTTSINSVTPNAYNTVGKNLIINGAMQIAQRGTSSTSSGYQTVDRWNNTFGGASITQTQQSLTSGSPFDAGFRNFARMEVTTASNLAGDYAQFWHKIEAQNIANSGWNYKSPSSYITLSFWARSSLAGTYSFFVRSTDGTSQSFSHNFTLAADTWTKITKSIPGDSAIQIDNDTGVGFDVFIVPHYGTTYTTSGHTSDAWQTYSGSDIMTDFAQNWTNTLNATFDVTGVQLEVGESATEFEHRPYGTELSLCQRYYQKSYNDDDVPGTATYNGAFGFRSVGSTGTNYLYLPLSTKMRASPTVVFYGTTSATNSAGKIRGSSDTAISASTGVAVGQSMITVNFNSNIAYSFITGHYTATAEL
jgi:hypothetical protein